MDSNKSCKRGHFLPIVFVLSLLFVIFGCGTRKAHLEAEIRGDEPAIIMGTMSVTPFFIRGTSVFSVDGEKISSSDKGIVIPPGKHTVVIKDSLLFLFVVETARARLHFVAKPGHRYKIKVIGLFRKWVWIEDVDTKVVVGGKSPWL